MEESSGERNTDDGDDNDDVCEGCATAEILLLLLRLLLLLGLHLFFKPGRWGGFFLSTILHVFVPITSSSSPSSRYKHVLGHFSNPNAYACTHTLDWLSDVVNSCVVPHLSLQQHAAGDGGNGALDLLELYCGNGNHTVMMIGGV
jgi:hypothetical protein